MEVDEDGADVPMRRKGEGCSLVEWSLRTMSLDPERGKSYFIFCEEELTT